MSTIMRFLLRAYHTGLDEIHKYRKEKQLQQLYNSIATNIEMKPFTMEEEAQIQAYWQPLIGKKISTRWHCLLYSLTGSFSVAYEPFEVCCHVQDTLSPFSYQAILDDKCLYRFLLRDFDIPQRVAECFDGVYYVGGRQVSFKTFMMSLYNLPPCIIKPSRVYSGGIGVQLLEVINGIEQVSNSSINYYIESYIKRYGRSFCIELKIEECENLKKLNPSSCNTLRVHTFRNKKEHRVKCASAYIRIGRKGKIVDNAYSGGICGKICENGELHGAVSCYPYKTYKETDNGVSLEGYKIEQYDKIVETVVHAHETLPMFDLMGWDVAVDAEGKIVIIEFNPNPDLKLEQCILVLLACKNTSLRLCIWSISDKK